MGNSASATMAALEFERPEWCFETADVTDTQRDLLREMWLACDIKVADDGDGGEVVVPQAFKNAVEFNLREKLPFVFTKLRDTFTLRHVVDRSLAYLVTSSVKKQAEHATFIKIMTAHDTVDVTVGDYDGFFQCLTIAVTRVLDNHPKQYQFLKALRVFLSVLMNNVIVYKQSKKESIPQ